MSEIAGLGSVFLGLGLFFILFMLSLFLLQIIRFIQSVVEKEAKYELFEEKVLEKLALKKGIDLMKAGIEKRVVSGKTFREKVQEEMIFEMWPEKKPK
jgi:hypothetical protein